SPGRPGEDLAMALLERRVPLERRAVDVGERAFGKKLLREGGGIAPVPGGFELMDDELNVSIGHSSHGSDRKRTISSSTRSPCGVRNRNCACAEPSTTTSFFGPGVRAYWR